MVGENLPDDMLQGTDYCVWSTVYDYCGCLHLSEGHASFCEVLQKAAKHTAPLLSNTNS